MPIKGGVLVLRQLEDYLAQTRNIDFNVSSLIYDEAKRKRQLDLVMQKMADLMNEQIRREDVREDRFYEIQNNEYLTDEQARRARIDLYRSYRDATHKYIEEQAKLSQKYFDLLAWLDTSVSVADRKRYNNEYDEYQFVSDVAKASTHV